MSWRNSLGNEDIRRFLTNIANSLGVYVLVVSCMVMFASFILQMDLSEAKYFEYQSIIEIGDFKFHELTHEDVKNMLEEERNNGTKERTWCQFPPKNMHGRQIYKYNLNVPDLDLKKLNSGFQHGGRYVPEDCLPIARIAIIIPYRDREKHLKILLHNIIPKLKRQKLDFTIYVIEQTHSSPFNRGMVRNIGFSEASKIADYDCYIFNDVDTLMEDDRNMYLCNKRAVRHLLTGYDTHGYQLDYLFLVGGVIAFTKEQFLKINGYTNQLFFWGGEDDELYKRMRCSDMKLYRPVDEIGKYTIISHHHDAKEPDRHKVLRENTDNDVIDGVKNLVYKRLEIEYKELYTRILVDIDEKLVRQSFLDALEKNNR